METHKVLETENTEEKTNKQTARARARAPNARARCAAILLAGGRRPIFTLQLRKNGRVNRRKKKNGAAPQASTCSTRRLVLAFGI